MNGVRRILMREPPQCVKIPLLFSKQNICYSTGIYISINSKTLMQACLINFMRIVLTFIVVKGVYHFPLFF